MDVKKGTQGGSDSGGWGTGKRKSVVRNTIGNAPGARGEGGQVGKRKISKIVMNWGESKTGRRGKAQRKRQKNVLNTLKWGRAEQRGLLIQWRR